MSEHVEGLNRDQTALFPDTLEGYVDKENPVRFIDAFVDSLNMESSGFKHSILAEVGRPSYDPSDLLKLYVYGSSTRSAQAENWNANATETSRSCGS